MADRLFTEFENENRYRSYPFSESASLEDTDGFVLSQDVVVDAILYPVNPSGLVRLTRLDFLDGVIEFSDDSGVVASGRIPSSGRSAWVYDVAGFEDHTCGGIPAVGKPVGRVVFGPGLERETRTGRAHLYDGAVMAPSSVCPIAYSGVRSITVEGGVAAVLPCLSNMSPSSVRLEDRMVGLVGEGRLVSRTATLGGKTYLWFDVLQDYSDTTGVEVYDETIYKAQDRKDTIAVKTLVVAAEAKSLFDISSIGGNDILVTMGALDREDVCYQANREAVSSKARIDVCPDVGGGDMPCNPEEGEVPPKREERIVVSGAADVGLLTPDLANYKNPVWIGSGGGAHSHPQYPRITDDMSEAAAVSEIQKLHGNPVVSGGGLEIAIPGAGGIE